jgi:Endodeoxyribonuclease RusA
MYRTKKALIAGRPGCWMRTCPRGTVIDPSSSRNIYCRKLVLHAKKVDSGIVNNVQNSIYKNTTRKRILKNVNEIPYWKREDDNICATIRDSVIARDKNSFGKTADFLKILSKGKFSKMQFMVRGNPQPLRRHRTRGGFMYNPSASAQEAFRCVVRNYLKTLQGTTDDVELISPTLDRAELTKSTTTVIVDDHDKKPTTLSDGKPGSSPIFLPNQQLAMTIVFNMKRPQNHFVSSKRGPGRLRKQYNTTHLLRDDDRMDMYPTTSSDVDNLAKFVLDSMNDILYADDRQIVSLHAIKVYDSFCVDNDSCCLGSTNVCIRSIDSPAEMNRMIIQATL